MTFILTEEFLTKHLTNGRGFKRKQAEALGEKYPLVKGWKERIIGKEYPLESIRKFVKASGKSELLKEFNKGQGNSTNTKPLVKRSKIERTSLSEAISLANWLVTKKGKTIKTAINIASKNKNCPDKDAIAKGLESELPSNILTTSSSEELLLKEAINEGVWLINNSRMTLKNVIDKVAEKHSYKPKTHIEKGIRAKFDENFFSKRAKAPAGSGYNHHRRQIETHQNLKHIKSIMNES